MSTPLPLPWQVVIGAAGQPVPGARLYAYRTGSTTYQATYADPGFAVAHSNPVVADAYGVLPVIYLDDRGPAYTLILTDADGAAIPGRQADAIAATGSGGSGGSGTGENAFYAVLTRQTTTVPADSSGVVSSFDSADGDLRVFNGGLDITPLCEISVSSQVNCTGTINTALDTPVVGQSVGYYRITAMTSSVAELRFHVVYGTRTTDAVFTVTKAVSGAQGTPGAAGGGANSIYLDLSRGSAFVPAYADGSVISYADAVGNARMFDGATDVTASTTWSVTTASATATINTATDTPVVGQAKGYFRVTAISADVATVTVQGTYNAVTYNKVFTVTKLKGGYEIVAVLPSTNLFAGRLVFLTTDGKLYRYTGSAWTAAVAAVDISGLLADAQIAAIAAGKITGLLTSSQINDIAAAKITGQIGSTQISDGAISTPKLAAGAVTASQIAAGTITGDRIAANAITANNILALSISGDKLAANTIAGDKILAGTITAANIAGGTITSDKIAAGQIIAAQLQVTELSSISANVGTVTAGVLQNISGTAKFDLTNAQIVLNTGAYMKVQGIGFGSTNQFIEWFGPTQTDLANCTELNAVSYKTITGNEYMGGTLAAGRISNTGQTTDTSSSAEIVVGSFLTNGGTKTIVVSYAYADTYRCNESTGSISGSTGAATVSIQKSIGGGAYSVIGTLNAVETQRTVAVDGEPGIQDTVIFRIAGSTTITDNTAATTDMKLRAVITSRTLATMGGTTITGRLTTQTVAIVSNE